MKQKRFAVGFAGLLALLAVIGAGCTREYADPSRTGTVPTFIGTGGTTGGGGVTTLDDALPRPGETETGRTSGMTHAEKTGAKSTAAPADGSVPQTVKTTSATAQPTVAAPSSATGPTTDHTTGSSVPATTTTRESADTDDYLPGVW